MTDIANPPAFPSHSGDPEMNDPRNRVSCGGMTLRDYFAGQALPHVITAMQSSLIADHPSAGGGPTGFAATSYDIADAMLIARTKGGEA